MFAYELQASLLAWLAFERTEADRDGLQDARLDQFSNLVDALRRAFRCKSQASAQRAFFDAQIVPLADGKRRIVVEEADGIFLKRSDVPTLGRDDVAHPIDALVGHNEVEAVLDLDCARVRLVEDRLARLGARGSLFV